MATRKRAVKKAALPRNKWIKGEVKITSAGKVQFKTRAVKKNPLGRFRIVKVARGYQVRDVFSGRLVPGVCLTKADAQAKASQLRESSTWAKNR